MHNYHDYCVFWNDGESRWNPPKLSSIQSGPFLLIFRYFLVISGSAVFAFSAGGVIIPIYESMEKPHHFLCLWWAGVIVCFLVYIAMGIVPYFAYGYDGMSQPVREQVSLVHHSSN